MYIGEITSSISVPSMRPAGPIPATLRLPLLLLPLPGPVPGTLGAGTDYIYSDSERLLFAKWGNLVQILTVLGRLASVAAAE